VQGNVYAIERGRGTLQSRTFSGNAGAGHGPIFQWRARPHNASRIIPVAGRSDLSEDEAKTKGADFLVEELKVRLKTGPAQFSLIVQFPNPGDLTHDPSQVWPDDRRTVNAGTISITSIDANSVALEKKWYTTRPI